MANFFTVLDEGDLSPSSDSRYLSCIDVDTTPSPETVIVKLKGPAELIGWSRLKSSSSINSDFEVGTISPDDLSADEIENDVIVQPDLMQSIQRYYAGDIMEICQLADKHPSLAPVLAEAPQYIQRHLNTQDVKVSIFQPMDSPGEDQVLITFKTSLQPRDVRNRLNGLWDAWLSQVPVEIRSILTITPEFV